MIQLEIVLLQWIFEILISYPRILFPRTCLVTALCKKNAGVTKFAKIQIEILQPIFENPYTDLGYLLDVKTHAFKVNWNRNIF